MINQDSNLSEKAKLALKHTRDKKRIREYHARLQAEERKAKRAAKVRKVDDPTPCKKPPEPTPELVARRIEMEYMRELKEIESYHEL